MKTRFNTAIVAFAVLFGLTSCSTAPLHQTKPISEKKAVKDHGKAKWRVVSEVPWSKTYEGLKMTIEKVSVANHVSNIEWGKVKTPAVHFKFKLKNTSSEYKFDIHPDEAVLMTSTGDEYKADMFLSDSFAGKMSKGERKTGKVGFYLSKNSDLNQIDQVWLKFKVTKISSDRRKEKYVDTEKIRLK